MATAVHIPIEELAPETRALLERVRDGNEIFIDGHHEEFRISVTTARSLRAILSDPTIVWSNVIPDDDWAKDLEHIISLRKQETADPWAE